MSADPRAALPPASERGNEERRLGRILAMIVLIADDPGRWTRAELAERYGVSERMITKDLALMRHVGLRIGKHSPGGYYFIDPGEALLAVCGRQEGTP